jgi:hypothetical protein
VGSAAAAAAAQPAKKEAALEADARGLALGNPRRDPGAAEGEAAAAVKGFWRGGSWGEEAAVVETAATVCSGRRRRASGSRRRRSIAMARFCPWRLVRGKLPESSRRGG